ncbi:MAG: voltage-gated potassium channel protein [Chromatiaceae bacterium]|jgi:voltage-gated potassium channel
MRLHNLLPRHLAGGLRERLLTLRAMLERWLRLNAWFPHALLALGVALAGLLGVVPTVKHLVGATSLPTAVNVISRELVSVVLRGAPRGVFGVVLLAMSVGLLLRSRFAWVISLMMIGATIALGLHGGITPVPSLVVYNGVLLLLLLLWRRHFDRTSLAAATLFGVTSAVLLLGYAVFGSYLFGKGFSPPINDLTSALYFAVVTMSTVGYGDIVPKTPEARFFVASMIILGIAVFATAISAVIVPILSRQVQRLVRGPGGKMERKNHYVIVGRTSLARNAYREMRARGLPLTVILADPPDPGEFEDADLVVGDASELDTLRSAGVLTAEAVLALSAVDSDNAFVVLAVKELESRAKTVVAVNDSNNLGRVQRVQPDLIIAPQVLGGELLAMVLSGENPDSQTLLARLLHMTESPVTE